MTSLLGLSALSSAADQSQSQTVNVNVNDGEGKIIIKKMVNGESQTVVKDFTADPSVDVDTLVAEVLAEHGIEHHNGKQIHKKVIELQNDSDNEFVWVQKSNNVSLDLVDGKATVVIKKDDNGDVQVIEESFDLDKGQDINVLIDDMMAEHGIEINDANVHRKIIQLDKSFTSISDDKPRLGFMASVKDEGWEVISVVPNSGAAQAGIQTGDLLISIDGQSTAKGGLGLTEFIAREHQAGDTSEIQVVRDGKAHSYQVTAEVIDTPDVIMEFDDNHKWFSSSGNSFTFNTENIEKMFEGLQVDVTHLDKMVEGLGDHDIRVVTTGDADAYFFSGSKMNQWLGKKHHFSTITETLGQYFGTTQGVLVLEVDQNNKLGLKDGDVIQAINGQDVHSPKDVVKVMSGFKSDSSFEIEIIRNKETIYLES